MNDLEKDIERAYQARWWEDHDKVVVTAYFLAEEGYPASEVARMVEKPWSYTQEWLFAEHAANEDGGLQAWLSPAEDPEPLPGTCSTCGANYGEMGHDPEPCEGADPEDIRGDR